jgi:hypothetical protein
MKLIAITMILLVASGTALVYNGNHRGIEAGVETVAGGQALASETQVLSSTQTELDVSNRVWPIYAEVLSRIRGYLEAHIAESGDSSITVDLPPLPANLYTDRYSGTVIFGSAIVWAVEVFAPRPAGLRSPPTLTIRFDEQGDLQEGPRLIFSLDTMDDEVAIIATNSLAPSVGPLPVVIPEEEPDAAIAQLTRSIIEGQLLRLGPANP